MDKFSSIINEYVDNFSLRSDTSFPTNVTKWNIPTAPNVSNASNNKISNVSTNFTDSDDMLPNTWSDNEAADFFENLDSGNMIGALSILVGDPSLVNIFNETQIKNTLEVPLDNMIASINQTGMLTGESNEVTEPSQAVPPLSASETPQPDAQITNLTQQLPNIINTSKTISDKLKGLFSEQNIMKILSNFNIIDGKNARLSVLKPKLDKWGETAINSTWRDELNELSLLITGNGKPLPTSEKFNIILNDYRNLNQLNEVGPAIAAGIAAMGGTILLAMSKYFAVSTAVSIVNLFGFIIARSITMPLRIFMIVVDKLKKYKNFLLGIFMPVQIISGVIINSGDAPGKFTGPMMQEWLQKITDFGVEISTDIVKLLGLDNLLNNTLKSGQGWPAVFKRGMMHAFTPSKLLK